MIDQIITPGRPHPLHDPGEYDTTFDRLLGRHSQPKSRTVLPPIGDLEAVVETVLILVQFADLDGPIDHPGSVCCFDVRCTCDVTRGGQPPGYRPPAPPPQLVFACSDGSQG